MNIYMLIDEKPYGSNVYAFSTKKAAQNKMRKLLKSMIPLAEFDCGSIDEAVERGYCDIYDGTFITNDKGVKYEDCTSVIIYERELDNDKYDESLGLDDKHSYPDIDELGCLGKSNVIRVQF